MKLEGIHDGSICASCCRSFHVEDGTLDFRRVGDLPMGDLLSQSPQRLLQTNCVTKPILTKLFGSFPTMNIWPVDGDLLYGARGRAFLRSRDGGDTWKQILKLPASSGPMGVLPTAVDVTGDELLLGEYPLDRSVQPRIQQSTDEGESWTTIAKPDARHVHAVTVDPYTGDRWVTTGDDDDESMIGRLTDDGIEIVGIGSQLWRAVDLVFTPDAVLWGMDCPYRDKNRIVRLSRNQINVNDPTVETLHTVSSPVYFAETLETDDELHVFFSTAIEPATEPDHTVQVIHGSTADGFNTWQTIECYRRSSKPFVDVIDTNAYVFLATDAERGLFVNPYNTDTEDGTIRNVPISEIQTIGD